MSRNKRFSQLNLCHHVMLRGNNGQKIFYDDRDRIRFCLLLQYASEKYFFRIHAFCFMSNHIHLLIEPKDNPLEEGVHSFSFRYAKYFNFRHNKTGHLFQGRFKSICVQDEMYFRRLMRYIHLNPCYDKIVLKPENYPWSSHRAYLGIDTYTWLYKEKVLSNFGSSFEDSHHNLMMFIHQSYNKEEENAEIAEAFQRGYFEEEEKESNLLNQTQECADQTQESSQKYILKQPQEKQPTLNELAQFICSKKQINISDLCSLQRKKEIVDARAILSLMVQQSENITLEELSKFLNKDSSTLSKLGSKAAKENEKKLLVNEFFNNYRNV